MQREISDRVFLQQNVSPFKNAGLSDVIDTTALNYIDSKDEVKKIRELVKAGNYDADIATSPEFLKWNYKEFLTISTEEKK